LGGIRRKETINALERRRNTVFAGERNPMQTLGVKNEFTRNRNRSTLDSKQRRGPHFSNGAVVNHGFDEMTSDEDGMDVGDKREIAMSMYRTSSRVNSNDSLTHAQSHI